MKIVCITGIDGAGKSTLAKNLVSILEQDGIKTRYIYGRTIPVLSRLLMAAGRLVLLHNQNPWTNFTQYTSNKRKVMKNPVLRFFYISSIWIDYFLQIWLKLFPRLLGKQIVIVDRYIYDTVISDLSVHLGFSIEDTMRVINKTMRFIPRPLLTLVVDLPEELAFSRKTDIPDIDYLRERRSFYQALLSRPEVQVVDGTLPAQTVLTGASAAIKACLGTMK